VLARQVVVDLLWVVQDVVVMLVLVTVVVQEHIFAYVHQAVATVVQLVALVLLGAVTVDVQTECVDV
jgi:hypothetical protein